MKPSHLRSLVRLYLLEELKALGNPAISEESVKAAEKQLFEANFTSLQLENILADALRTSAAQKD